MSVIDEVILEDSISAANTAIDNVSSLTKDQTNEMAHAVSNTLSNMLGDKYDNLTKDQKLLADQIALAHAEYEGGFIDGAVTTLFWSAVGVGTTVVVSCIPDWIKKIKRKIQQKKLQKDNKAE